MAATKNFTIDDSAYVEITAASVCRQIDVYEDNQAGTTDVYYSGSGDDADKVTKPAGSMLHFDRTPQFYQPGDSVGFIKAKSAGTVTFAQEER